MNSQGSRDLSSFRDPSGFVFERDGEFYRQINQSYREDFDHILSSGLYQTLVENELLIPHEESETDLTNTDGAYKIIKPDQLAFISYPYEWSFSALRQAAIATLRIQYLSLNHGMVLKDASAYNIQFHKGKPTLIDTLSFQRWTDGRPWDGYRQFCQHFFAPLALMAYRDVRLSRLLTSFIDGVPLDLASTLLPRKTYLRLSILTHIHLHSKMQKRASEGSSPPESVRRVPKNSLMGMTQNLLSGINSLRWDPGRTPWGEYYDTFSYSEEAFKHKEAIVQKFVELAQPSVLWDIGANTGKFSRIASNKGIFTVSMDIDPGAVEDNFHQMLSNSEKSLLPLVMDITNPSPSLGWRSRERTNLIDRGPVDAILALALFHHLAIGNNLPFQEIARFFAELCEWLLIEFIPKDDDQIKRMLSVRKDIFDTYSNPNFEREFSNHFTILKKDTIQGSSRILYTMKKLSAK
jgi:hypothetical protein